MVLVAGVDSSTQSCKVEVRDLDSGEVVATGRAAHPPTQPPRSEQDPESWWTALSEAFEQVGSVAAEVAAIGVAGQQHGLVVLDHSGVALRPAKLWNDTESAGHAEQLVARLGAETWAGRTGSVPVASFTITKLAWLVANEPHLVAAIERVMLPHDYLNFRLCGRFATDRGDASGSGWFDPSRNEIAHELLAEVGGRDDWAALVPAVLAPTDVLGTVTGPAATATGLREGIPVSVGTGDNMAAALGLGLSSGDLALSLGTSGVVYAVSETASSDPTGAVAGFADASGRFLPLVCTLNATKVTDTVRRWLGFDQSGFSDAALSAPPGANGVRLTPYFDGERTPNLPDATGTFEGLRNDTTPADLARAAHEGVLNGLLFGMAALAQAGAATGGRLHLIGGGAKSPAYRQLLADMHGAPIRVPDAEETVATGAAVQAAMMLGHQLDDLESAWRLGAGTDVDPDQHPR
jgi:xylulokinase